MTEITEAKIKSMTKEQNYMYGYIRGYRHGESDMLDNIKVEIKRLHDWAFTREEILNIIDKYKVESEANE